VNARQVQQFESQVDSGVKVRDSHKVQSSRAEIEKQSRARRLGSTYDEKEGHAG
jgi:hypothetical protein